MTFNIGKISIKQANNSDIQTLVGIYADTLMWLDEMGQRLWGPDEVTWEALSKDFQPSDFYIAYLGDMPAGCMALVDHDPFFWPEFKKGESLYIHKLAVVSAARKTGAADALIDFFKAQGASRGVSAVRLDTHALRPKLRAFYERHGFKLVKTVTFEGGRHSAFYTYMIK